MLKQKMALLLAAAMLAGAVSGCSNSQQGGEVSADSGASAQSEGSSQAENQEPVTIKFVGYANSAAGFEARAEEFISQRSDIKVEVQGIPANSWGELMQAISVNIAGGDVPDIADIASEGQRSFAASGIIIPIDEYLERDKEEMKETLDEIDPALMETMKYDGKTYCLPTVWNNILLYYNKNVLERFNIPEPESGWTIDDFIEICQTVTSENDGTNDVYGYAFGNAYFNTIVPWMIVSGGNVLNDDWTESRLTDPDTLAGVQLLYDFVYKYNISPKIDAGVADLDLFVQDKLAFMSAGMWQVNALKNADFPVDDYDVVDLPIVKEDKAVIGVGGAPIFAASEHQDAAWEFAKFLSSKDFQDTFIVEDGWSIPAVKSAADTLAAKDFAPAHADLFYASAQKGVMVPAPQEYGAIESVLLREFGAAMANMKTMEEAMAAAEEEINAEIAKRG